MAVKNTVIYCSESLNCRGHGGTHVFSEGPLGRMRNFLFATTRRYHGDEVKNMRVSAPHKAKNEHVCQGKAKGDSVPSRLPVRQGPRAK